MLLASVGLYSLIALVVAARTREIGVRIALGAEPSRILGLVFSGATRLFGTGILIGLVLTAAAERVIRSALFEVSPLDAYSMVSDWDSRAGVCGRSVSPARRAAAIDPLVAMRMD